MRWSKEKKHFSQTRKGKGKGESEEQFTQNELRT